MNFMMLSLTVGWSLVMLCWIDSALPNWVVSIRGPKDMTLFLLAATLSFAITRLCPGLSNVSVLYIFASALVALVFCYVQQLLVMLIDLCRVRILSSTMRG